MKPITYQNNWESHVYLVDGTQSTSFDHVYLNGVRMYVRWQKVDVPYMDHGHAYTATSLQCYVQSMLAGVTVEVALSDLIAKGAKVETD